jgi:tetratricopeptide (TPR) repeat protein
MLTKVMARTFSIAPPISVNITMLVLVLAAAAGLGAPIPQGLATPPVIDKSDPKELDEAASKYEKLVKEHPRSPELWSNLGAVRAMAGNCTQALPALQRAQTLNASLFSPWYFAGYCFFALHQDQLAIESLARATRLNPKDPNAWFLKAQVAADLGDLEGSLESVVRSLSLGGGRAQGYYLAGKDALDLAANSCDRVMRSKPNPNFYSLVLDGERNAAQGVGEVAIEDYRHALKLSPHDGALWFALGTVYLETSKYPEAEEAFRQCLKRCPHSSWAALRLTLALLEPAKRSEALTVFRTVALEDLQIPQEYEDFISCAYLLNLPDLANTALTEAEGKFRYYRGWSSWSGLLASRPVKQTDAHPVALKLEGLTGVGLLLRFDLSSHPEKAGCFEALFAKPDDYENFRSNFVRAHWVEAARQIVPLLKTKLQMTDSSRWFALGETLQTLSYAFFERLGGEFPDSGPAMRLAAENFSAMGQQDKALEIYEGILQKEGPSPELLRDVAKIYWLRHDWDHALPLLQQLATLDGHDATIFVNLGRIYSYQQKTEEAEENFRLAIHIDPSVFEGHLGLAQALRHKGDNEDALRELKIASGIDPSNPRTHYELSQIYTKLGDRKLAGEEMASFKRLTAAGMTAARERNGELVPLD